MRSILINVSIESNIQDGSGKQQKDGSHGNPIIPRYLVMRHLVETMEMPHFVCLLELNIGAMSEQWTLYDVNDDVIDKKSLITETPKISDVCLMRLEIAQRMNDVIDYVTRSTIRRRRKLGGRSSGSGVGVVTSRSGSSNQLEGDVIGNCLFLSSLAGDTATCERILSSGWNYPITSKYGNTPLHVAAFHGRLDIIRLLVQHQFPIRLENHNGNTAMNLAVKRGFFNVASYLWSHHWMETPFLLPDSSVTLWSFDLKNSVEDDENDEIYYKKVLKGNSSNLSFAPNNNHLMLTKSLPNIATNEEETKKIRQEKVKSAKPSSTEMFPYNDDEVKEWRRMNEEAFAKWLQLKATSKNKNKETTKFVTVKEEPKKVYSGLSHENWLAEKAKIKKTEQSTKIKHESISSIAKEDSDQAFNNWLEQKKKMVANLQMKHTNNKLTPTNRRKEIVPEKLPKTEQRKEKKSDGFQLQEKKNQQKQLPEGRVRREKFKSSPDTEQLSVSHSNIGLGEEAAKKSPEQIRQKELEFEKWRLKKKEEEVKKRKEEERVAEKEKKNMEKEYDKWKRDPKVISFKQWSKRKQSLEKFERLSNAQLEILPDVDSFIRHSSCEMNEKIFKKWVLRKEQEMLQEERTRLRKARLDRIKFERKMLRKELKKKREEEDREKKRGNDLE